MTEQFATAIINGDFNRTLGVFTQKGGSARDGEHISNMNRFIRGNINTANGIGAFISGATTGCK